MPQPAPHALRDAPALIEKVFPAQKISFEAQKERKAGAGQTLTALGSYWKGRKPLILVRAILLASLLPQTEDAETDLEIFEQLMAIDDHALARREPKLSAAEVARRITLYDPWPYFDYTNQCPDLDDDQLQVLRFPLDVDDYPGLRLRWARGIDPQDKQWLLAQALETFGGYEARAALCKRPEELGQRTLYAPIWEAVNAHLARYGVEAHSHAELVEQLGILRFGHRPRVGDTFCGGGSIPFEAARLGCDVYASDLNPIACMLTWGALNIIGAPAERRAEIQQAQRQVAEAVDREITQLGIEHDAQGNRAKAYLYCLETRCPETGWLVPMAPSWVISRNRNVYAKLIPDPENKRFNIEIVSGASKAEMEAAQQGTVRDGCLVYELEGRSHRTPIKTLRGDYRDAEGHNRNRLRPWEKQDFKPRPDLPAAPGRAARAGDIFQEHLYCIQWIEAETLDSTRPQTFFASVTEADLERERKVEEIVATNLADWQRNGLMSDMEIEPGGPPRYQGRSLVLNMGWTHWHHAFNPRTQLVLALLLRNIQQPVSIIFFARLLNRTSKLCMWEGPSGYESTSHVFVNQALNELNNWGVRGWSFLEALFFTDTVESGNYSKQSRKFIDQINSSDIVKPSDLWITDPPYANAVMYHEITEFFIAWLRKNPPAPFDQWTWDSRRALAIKGSGDEFRRGMVEAYSAMTAHMPGNGMQCVMFTHQDSGVWSDMVSIFWAAGLQVVGAWYIATETTSELKKGGYVQGTVILMLRKRPAGERPGFKQKILPQVRKEVEAQIREMMHLNDQTDARMGAPVFNDSDLQMAGYAAALKVLTGYTHINGEDVTEFALRPHQRGDTTVVDAIVEQAAESANTLLVPEGLERDTWAAASGVERFYLRMLDMETTGAGKLDNYQNFAKAFRVGDYQALMASLKPNAARLKTPAEFAPRELGDKGEIGPTPLGALITAMQELLAEKEPELVHANLREALEESAQDYRAKREPLIDIARFLARKLRDPAYRQAAETLANRVRNEKAI